MKALLLSMALLACGKAAEDVPAELKPPAEQKEIARLAATGVQIYACTDGKWVFQAPEADLVDAAGKPAGHHYKGPTWESTDGSKVVGAVKQKHDATAGDIPWLLLEAKSTEGTGLLAGVKSIQRLATKGGAAPDGACTGADTIRRDYRATYVFYR